MEAINSIHPKLRKKQLHRGERKQNIAEMAEILALTCGEREAGIGLSYDRKWCYHPLLISLANTVELRTWKSVSTTRTPISSAIPNFEKTAKA